MNGHSRNSSHEKQKKKKRVPLAKIIQVNLKKKKNKTERKVKGCAVRLEFMVGYVIGESFFHVIRRKSETISSRLNHFQNLS